MTAREEYEAVERELAEEDGRVAVLAPTRLEALLARLDEVLRTLNPRDPTGFRKALAEGQDGPSMAGPEEETWSPEEQSIGRAQSLTQELRARRQRSRR